MKKIVFVLFCYMPMFCVAEQLTLQELWQTSGLQTPESVVYHKASNSLYVSNINGSPLEKDGNGYISKISLEGEITEPQWIAGLDAPKGLAIFNDRLYVADIDTLIEIDITAQKISQRHHDPEAKFFNDVAVDIDGTVYVADSFTNTIHSLINAELSVWLISPDLRGPNGLFVESDRIIVTAWGVDTEEVTLPGQVLSVSKNDKHITIIGNEHSEGNLDGIQKISNHDYLFTKWTKGELGRVARSGDVSTLLSLGKGTADFGYIPEQELLLLPQMMKNTLIAYKIIFSK